MKRLLPWLPALCILLAAGLWYLPGAVEEQRLLREGRTPPPAASAASPGSAVQTSAVTSRPLPPKNPPLPPKLLTPADLEKWMEEWTTKVLDEERRLVETKGKGKDGFYQTEEKFAPWLAMLPSVADEDLFAMCASADPETSFHTWSMNVRSSPKEVRDILIYRAAQTLAGRDPFKALALPRYQTPGEFEKDCAVVLSSCARRDPAAAWRAVQEKYGGAGAPEALIRGLLAGAADNLVTRMEYAEKWGLQDRVAGLWAGSASRTPEERQAWLTAVRRNPPDDLDSKLAGFAKEVETSGGFTAFQEIIPEIAPPGTPLYDRLLAEAADRDLEESAAPRAAWLLARATPESAPALAETLIRRWTDTDPLAASEWLNTVPAATPWRRQAVLAFAGAIELHDPEAAGEWRRTAESAPH